jgi:hypothetical protein
VPGSSGVPTTWEITGAWLRYEASRLRAGWRVLTGRCPGCPKPRGGQHKLGCTRPAVPPSLHSIRSTRDHEENDHA